jgi:hypothetical protein
VLWKVCRAHWLLIPGSQESWGQFPLHYLYGKVDIGISICLLAARLFLSPALDKELATGEMGR